MTTRTYNPPKSPEALMRDHIKAMRDYACDLQAVLGADSPIVKRIRGCATSNEMALDRVMKLRPESCGCERAA